jgi:Cu(I)/Ag(I) efflux system periplasmic protein CusF
MFRIAAAFTFLLSLAWPAFAQSGQTEGEIRRVDRESGKITLRHGPIAGALEMPAMSMVFQVKDPALLDRLQPGDRVEARILKENGVFYIQSAEKKN